jgi:HSP20 family protein
MRNYFKFDTHFPAITKVVDNFFGNDGNFLKPFYTPAINIKESEKDFKLELFAAGFQKEDFKIELENNHLIISAEVKEKNLKEDEKYTHIEHQPQSFKRTFSLSKLVDTDKIQANYQNGILEITIAKKEEAKPKPVRLIDIL